MTVVQAGAKGGRARKTYTPAKASTIHKETEAKLKAGKLKGGKAQAKAIHASVARQTVPSRPKVNSGALTAKRAKLRDQAVEARKIVRAAYREQWTYINRQWSEGRINGNQHAIMERTLQQERDNALARIDAVLETELAALA